MKQKITKGKVIQNCLKATAAIVVASGVGFQFHEIQELNKEVTALEKNHKQTVQELKVANENNKTLEEQKKQIQSATEKLSVELEDLKHSKEAIEQEKQKSLEDNQKLQAENAELAKQVREAKESARPVKSDKPKSDNVKPTPVSNPTPSAAPTPSPAKNTSDNAGVSKTIMGVGTAYMINEPGVTGLTASGKKVQPGMIAMDRSVPFGTKVRITCESYPSINGIYTVEDRGGAIKGNIVDIYMTDTDRMYDFGRRDIKIEFLN
ncbi:3D domain-containing protein [Bacillus cereus]|uniref:3D domain-containing protein n=1 Tax=Bacillus cereus TaxID=1396 RepID=UPI003CFF4F68